MQAFYVQGHQFRPHTVNTGGGDGRLARGTVSALASLDPRETTVDGVVLLRQRNQTGWADRWTHQTKHTHTHTPILDDDRAADLGDGGSVSIAFPSHYRVHAGDIHQAPMQRSARCDAPATLAKATLPILNRMHRIASISSSSCQPGNWLFAAMPPWRTHAGPWHRLYSICTSGAEDQVLYQHTARHIPPPCDAILFHCISTTLAAPRGNPNLSSGSDVVPLICPSRVTPETYSRDCLSHAACLFKTPI